MTDTGRGAWTRRGFPAEFTKMYRRHLVAPATGAEPDKNQDFLAVHYGVLAIQNLLNYNGWVLDYSTGPGIFGPKTDKVVRSFQAARVPPADGIAGPNTLRALLRKPIKEQQTIYGIPDNLLAGLIAQESGYDPGAVGYITPSDLGLVQINTAVHPVTVEQAFDPFYSIPWAARRISSKYKDFLGDGAQAPDDFIRLCWDCAIASHNSPVLAQKWYAAKTPPTEKIFAYVQNVRKFGLLYG